ncbi:MAG: hypothetical protein Q9211_007060 [Gyalolechia sp. 1 TL-2023]
MSTQQSTCLSPVDWNHYLLTSGPSQLLVHYPGVRQLNNEFHQTIKTNIGGQYGNCLLHFLPKLDGASGAKNISVIRACFQVLVVFSIFVGNVAWLSSHPYSCIIAAATHIKSGSGHAPTQVSSVAENFKVIKDTVLSNRAVESPESMPAESKVWFAQQLRRERDHLLGEALTLVLYPNAPY